MRHKKSFSVMMSFALLTMAHSARAEGDAALGAQVDQRLRGDRTGACLAAAVIDHDRVARTFRCAADEDLGRIGPHTAFEVGSVTKTMTAALLALRIDCGEASIDDPLARFLPPETTVPSFEGAPILLRHVVTHTSGLPPIPARFAPRDPNDPYADLTEDALLTSLGDVRLDVAPGTRFAYSNFAFMVLSYALARDAKTDYPALLTRALFAPLGMKHAYVSVPPKGIRAAQGHLPTGAPTPPWTFPPNLAGVGGVRATLDDMVAYAQGQLGQVAGDDAIGPALRRTQARLSNAVPIGMSWMLMDVDGRTVHAHEGGTGGFSSLVGFDRARQRGVVILSDTSWNALGGLGTLGMHLLDSRFAPGAPRTVRTPDPALLAALAGTYRLGSELRAELRIEDGALIIQAEGQPPFALAYDSEGDFYPLAFDALLRPTKTDAGYVLQWFQGGGMITATRITPEAAPPR
ncbi:MAG: serine hydrolase [Polyangiales bacterium]